MEGDIFHTFLVSIVLSNRTHTLELRLSEGDIAEIYTRQLSNKSAITEVLRNCIAADPVQTEAQCVLMAVSFPPSVGRLGQVVSETFLCTRHDQTRQVNICIFKNIYFKRQPKIMIIL